MSSSCDNTESLIECNLSKSTVDSSSASFDTSINTTENSQLMDIWREQMEEEKRRSEQLQKEFEQLKAAVSAMQSEKAKLKTEIEQTKVQMTAMISGFREIRELVVGSVGHLVDLSEKMLVRSEKDDNTVVPRTQQVLPIVVQKSNRQQMSKSADEIIDNDIEY